MLAFSINYLFVCFTVQISLICFANGVKIFYNIAHMVNSIKQIDKYLSCGANAIELDVTFSLNGTALEAFHGFPCDAFRYCGEREDIVSYLSHVREITKPENAKFQKNLTLLFLDLKTSTLPASVKGNAGRDMAQKVIVNLFESGATSSKIKLHLSIQHVDDYDFVIGFQNELVTNKMQHLNSRIGWDVSEKDNVEDVIMMWQRDKIISNIWFGDGSSNWFSPFYDFERSAQIIKNRDLRSSDQVFSKVYRWTIDFGYKLRASLKLGVDGIMTNHPERLTAILEEPNFRSQLRLATQDDDPWERIKSYPGGLKTFYMVKYHYQKEQHEH